MKKISKIIIILITTFILTISLIVGNNVSMAKEETYNIKQAKDKLDKINSLIEEAKEYNKKGYKIDTTKLIEAQTICNQLYSNALLYEPAILYNNDVDTVEKALKKYEEDKVKLNIPNITTTNKDISGTSTVTSGTGSASGTSTVTSGTGSTSGTSTVTSGTGSTSGTSTATSGTGSTPETSSGLETSTSSSESSDFGDTYYIPKKLKRYPGNIYKVNASLGENKRDRGGKAGDQTGEEVTIKPFTGSRKFSIFRYPDSKVARTIAFYLGDIAANNNVGYDQDDRDTLGKEMAKVNYDPEKLATPCETDCSAFTSHGIKFAFMKAGISKSVSEDVGTGDLRDKLPEWGFQEISEIGTGTLEELAKTQKLQIGDIALTVGKGHVTVCIGDYYFSDQTPPSSPGAYGSGVSGGYTADGEEIDDRQNIDEKRFRFSGLPGDVTYEGEINPIRNFFKKIGDFIDYLLGLLFLIIKVLIIGFTNIIYNIFLIMVSFMKK